MKKKLLFILSVFMFSVSFISCSKDDDDEKDNNDVSIVGKWELAEASNSVSSKTITFYEDNTGLDNTDPMKWSLAGNSLTIMLDEQGSLPATFIVLSLTQDELSLQWASYKLKYKRVK